MIPNSRIQNYVIFLCQCGPSQLNITTWFDIPDALELMQYFFLKNQLNIWYLVNNLMASLQLYLPTFMFVRTV